MPVKPSSLSHTGERGEALSRRDVLIAGTAALAVTNCAVTSTPDAGPRTIDTQPFDHATRVDFAPEAIALSETLFPQALGAGVMKPDSFLAWTRAEGEAQLTLRVWREVGSSTEVALVHE